MQAEAYLILMKERKKDMYRRQRGVDRQSARGANATKAALAQARRRPTRALFTLAATPPKDVSLEALLHPATSLQPNLCVQSGSCLAVDLSAPRFRTRSPRHAPTAGLPRHRLFASHWRRFCARPRPLHSNSTALKSPQADHEAGT
jgi:hypothetical protein